MSGTILKLKNEYEMRWATPDEVDENRTDDETGKSLRSTKAEQGPPAASGSSTWFSLPGRLPCLRRDSTG